MPVQPRGPAAFDLGRQDDCRSQQRGGLLRGEIEIDEIEDLRFKE